MWNLRILERGGVECEEMLHVNYILRISTGVRLPSFNPLRSNSENNSLYVPAVLL